MLAGLWHTYAQTHAWVASRICGIGQSMSNTIWVPWGTYCLQIRTDFGYCDATQYVPVYLCTIYDCSTSHECSNNKLSSFSLLTTHYIMKSFIIVYVNHICVCEICHFGCHCTMGIWSWNATHLLHSLRHTVYIYVDQASRQCIYQFLYGVVVFHNGTGPIVHVHVWLSLLLNSLHALVGISM